MTRNEQARELGYTRYRVNGQEYGDYESADYECHRLPADIDIIFECYHEQDDRWVCFFRQWANYGAPLTGIQMDAEL